MIAAAKGGLHIPNYLLAGCITKLLGEQEYYTVDAIPDHYILLNTPFSLASIKQTLLTINAGFQGISKDQIYHARYDLETIVPTRYGHRGNRHHNLASDVSALTHFFDNKLAVSAFRFSTEFQTSSMFLLLLATECMVFFFLDLGFGRETQDQVLRRQNTETSCLLHLINAKHLIDLAAKNESKEYGSKSKPSRSTHSIQKQPRLKVGKPATKQKKGGHWSKHTVCHAKCNRILWKELGAAEREGREPVGATDMARHLLAMMKETPNFFGLPTDKGGNYELPKEKTISAKWFGHTYKNYKAFKKIPSATS